MATVTAFTPFDMNTYAILYGTMAGASPTFFQIQNSGQWQNYIGNNFTYDSFGNTGGVLNETYHYLNSALQYSVTGLNHSMATVNLYHGNNDPQGLLGFLLSANDTFIGSSGNDYAKGYGGSDSLDGGNGNDTLDGGTGADVLSGGVGADTYVLDDAGDAVSEAGAEPFPDGDTVIASFTYTLPPTMENLVLSGSAAINGTGNSFGNVMTGNGANNVLDGAAGNDTLDGGEGDDTLVGAAGDDQINGGNGNDWATYAAAASAVTLRLDFTTAQNTLGAGMDTLAGVENLTGSSFNDTLVGDTTANALNGGLSNDSLNGGDGNDSLAGGDGDDTMVGGAGNDQINGGNGTDWVAYAAAASAVTVVLGVTAAQSTLGAGTDTLNGIENLIGSSFSDTLTGTLVANEIAGGAGHDSMDGRAANDTLSGNIGNDILDGGTGDDILSGGAGHDVLNGATGGDTLTGAGGNDTLDGGQGIDRSTGGTGNDVYVIDESSEAVIELPNEGIDAVQSAVSAALRANVENLLLTGSANIGGTGNVLANVITGNNAANLLDGGGNGDSLKGSGGTDTLLGGAGNDTLAGGNGRDRLNGGGAADAMEGGAGNDTLIGGAGQDKFDFNIALNATTNVDTISGFQATADLIRLDDDVFTALAIGSLPARAWHSGAGVTTAHDHTDRVVYDNSTGNLYYDPDGTGVQAATIFATLTGTLAITAADFLIIA